MKHCSKCGANSINETCDACSKIDKVYQPKEPKLYASLSFDRLFEPIGKYSSWYPTDEAAAKGYEYRDLTPEEQRAYQKTLMDLSLPTGENLWDEYEKE
jgi:hypothetical protein